MIDIAVLAGGCSPEHDISLQSGAQVLQHLDAERFRVWPVYIDRDGYWCVPETPGQLAGSDQAMGFPTSGLRALRPGAALDFLLEQGLQVVFPALHGPFGEDGTVQGMLDLHGVAYVGSGCAASAVAMDKIRTRECLIGAGIPMPQAYIPALPIARAEPAIEAVAIEQAFGYPCFLKTDMSGSSLGVTRAENAADVAAFLTEAKSLGRRFMAEAGVLGEEISVPVLGNAGDQLEALPPIGIYPIGAEFFDYKTKYDPTACEEIVPPRGLSAGQIAEVQALALRCHEALQCDGLSRTDMIVTDTGVVVLEVNTMPGFTTASLYPQSAAAHGICYPDLLSRLVGLALRRPQWTRMEISS
jgi:D-alanine-D-alanine ligase